MLLRQETLDCKFEMLDGIERDLFNALRSAHIESGTASITDGQGFNIEVSEQGEGSITEVDLVVTIGIEVNAGEPLYYEKRKITILKSGSSWSMIRDIHTSNRELFSSIEISVNEIATASSGKLTFSVSGIDATNSKTTFKYFTHIKM